MASDPHSRRIATLRGISFRYPTHMEELTDEKRSLVSQLEIQLKEHVAERKSCLDKAYLTPRESLQRAYERTILNDWNAEDHDGESQMWKTCFYKPIEEWRRKIRAYTQVISDAQAKNDAKRLQTSIQDQAKTSAQFHTFLESSTGFYHNLLAKIRAKHGLSLDRSVLSSIGGVARESAEVASASTSNASKGSSSHHRMTIFRILIRLGDLARYQRDLTGFPDADWQAAWAYYLDAQMLLPEQGMPYNQLAVLCSYSHDEIGALFFYARSLALAVPSETGKSNIEVHMRDASMTKYLEARRKYLEHVIAPPKARVLGDGKSASERAVPSSNTELWKVFVHGYFGLHSAESSVALEHVQACLETLLEDFDKIVKSDHLLLHSPTSVPQNGSGYGNTTYMQLIVYNIFATWSVSTQFLESALSNETARLLLLRRLNLVMQFSLGMLNSLIERTNTVIANQSNWMDIEVSVSGTVGSGPAHGPGQENDSNPSELNIAKLETLPAIATYLHWLSTVSTRLVSFDYSASFERSSFDKLQQSLGTLLSSVLPYARRFNKLMHRYPSRGAPPLPEDVELFPFLPLNSAFSDTNFSTLSTIHDSEESHWRRCFKIAKFAQRLATDPLLIAATRTPIQDPLHHFASSTTTSSHASTGNNANPELGSSFISFNGIFLFTTTQIGDIHGYMTLEPESSSDDAILASHLSPSQASIGSHSFPSPSQPEQAHEKDVADASLHSQEFPVTSSGMRHSQHSQPLPIGEHITKLPSPTFDHQSSLNSALDQLADAISMDLDSSAHLHPQHPPTSSNLPRRASPIAVGPPKMLFQDMMMDTSDTGCPQDSPYVSPLPSSISPHGASQLPQLRYENLEIPGENRFPYSMDARHNASPSSSNQEISDPPPGQLEQIQRHQANGGTTSNDSHGYDPWSKFPGSSPHDPQFGPFESSLVSSALSPPSSRQNLGNAMEIAAEAPNLMSNGAPSWNPFLVSQFPSHGQHIAVDPLHNYLAAQPATIHNGRPLLFPGVAQPSQPSNGPP